MKVCVYGSARDAIDDDYKEYTEKLCEKLALRGHDLVFGGGKTGLMGAAARGFKKGGGHITAVYPWFFKEAQVEPMVDDADKTIFTTNMGDRKDIMEDMADAFIITPGGIGTFDEFFQIITLKHLKQQIKPIALYNIHGYYYSIQAMMHQAINGKFIDENGYELYQCFSEDDIDKLIEYIESDTKTE